ncbi:TetR/AcrR family transcriptional regulator [Bradyrhizobium sp. McL0615]|uniref:TetR/AcrR family transcriptional regulator n=1 Tax=Bradyrhizobium sp. McL0615 TaxID=3415673 RepID=UPI003CF422EE
MSQTVPKWRRRKDDRPAEIISAAIDIFAEKGFAAAKLDDVAKRAGIAKGTLYRYFETKDDMFRAVVQQAIAASLEETETGAAALQGSISDLVHMLLKRAANRMGDRRFPAIARMVIAESRTFPDLAVIWHDQLVSRMLGLVADLIAKAQARGEVKSGDPKLYAFSILGPMVSAVLFAEVLGGTSAELPDIDRLAAQHAETVLHGLLMSPAKRKRTP